jgi:tetratricopeptide (TPR) repeat protein
MLSLANPTEEGLTSREPVAHTRAMTILELMDEAAKRLDTSLEEWPLERAELHERFAKTYSGLLRNQKWRFHLRRAYELRSKILGDDDPETLHTLARLAFAINQTGGHQEAESYYQQAAEGLRRVAGPEDWRTLDAMGRWGFCLGFYQREHKRGRQLLQEVLDTQRRLFGAADSATVNTASRLLAVLTEMELLEEAEQLAREWLAICRTELGEDHLKTSDFLEDLARVRLKRGDAAGREKLICES